MSDLGAYTSLFLAAFIAASIFPAQSEALLLWLAAQGIYSLIALVAVASTGNTLGAIFNWGLGTRAEKFKNRQWFPVRAEKLEKAQDWYRRYGRWSLLFSWVPVIGDPITLAAGVMREKLLPFVLVVGTAKTLRYVFIVYAYLQTAGA